MAGLFSVFLPGFALKNIIISLISEILGSSISAFLMLHCECKCSHMVLLTRTSQQDLTMHRMAFFSQDSFRIYVFKYIYSITVGELQVE